MELEPEGRGFGVMKAHDCAVVVRRGVDDEGVGKIRCNEAVIAPDRHALMVCAEEATGLHRECGGLAVSRRGCTRDRSAACHRDALMAEADAEDGQSPVKGIEQGKTVGGLLGCSGPGSEEERAWRGSEGPFRERAVGSYHLDRHPHRTKCVDEVERKGVAVVYEEEHGGRLQVAEWAAWTMRLQVSRMGRWAQAILRERFE